MRMTNPMTLGGLFMLSAAMGCGSTPAPARDFEVTTTFSLAPGEERSECFRVNVPDDVFVSSITTSSTPGVHHQILAVATEKLAEGTEPCGLAAGASTSWIFHTGDSPEDFHMPANVALRVPGGSQLLLQMHLFNPSDAQLDSSVKTDLIGIAEEEVEHFAQLVSAGTLNISLPPGVATTVNAKCTLDGDVNVFGLQPHMHGMGTTFKTWIANAAGDQSSMLYDGAFLGVDDQPFATFEPVAMPKGGSLNIQCNYFNSSADRLVYGSSALDEMCFGLTYFYPVVESQGALCLK